MILYSPLLYPGGVGGEEQLPPAHVGWKNMTASTTEVTGLYGDEETFSESNCTVQ